MLKTETKKAFSKNLQLILLFFFFFSGVFQGMFTEDIFGSLARSMGFIFIPLISLFLLIKSEFQKKERYLVIILFFYLFTCALFLLNFQTSENFSYLKRSELDLFFRTIFGHFLIFLAFYLSIIFLDFKKNIILSMALVFFLFGLIGSFFDYFGILPSIIHHEIISVGTMLPEGRPYGIFYEASSAVVTICSLILIILTTLPDKVSTHFKYFIISIFFITIIWIYLIQSKGGVALLFLGAIVTTIYLLFKNLKLFFLSIPILACLAFIIFVNLEFLNEYLLRSIMLTNTFSTRALSIFTVYSMLLESPFGFGPGIFLFEYDTYLRSSYDLLMSFSLPINLYEVRDSLSTGISLWPKGTLASLSAQYGVLLIPFLLILFFPFYYLLFHREITLRSILIFYFYFIAVFQFLFFANGETEYVFFLSIVLLFSYLKIRKIK